MKIVIAGSGAMGCRYGAALFDSGHEVTLLDGWAGHVAAINEGGLRVTDESGTRVVPVPAMLFPAPAVPADLVIVFAKATGTAAVAAAAAGAIGRATLLLTLQNGLGNIEALACVRTGRATARGRLDVRHGACRSRPHHRARLG